MFNETLLISCRIIKKKQMTQEEIIQGNKLIAEFMGAKYDKDTTFPIHPDDLWLPFHGIVNCKTIESGNGKTIEYYSSWDWLMPVVEKINNGEDEGKWKYQINIYSNVVTVFSYEPMGTMAKFNNSDSSKIGAVWLAVIEFIKWFNTQNKK